jgi:hypothetical protein
MNRMKDARDEDIDPTTNQLQKLESEGEPVLPTDDELTKAPPEDLLEGCDTLGDLEDEDDIEGVLCHVESDNDDDGDENDY